MDNCSWVRVVRCAAKFASAKGHIEPVVSNVFLRFDCHVVSLAHSDEEAVRGERIHRDKIGSDHCHVVADN